MCAHINKWKAEHANYRKLLDLLESRTELFARGEQPDYELMSDVVYYLTQYPDRFHHPREDVAFGMLLAHDPSARDVVDELAGQHRQIEASGATLAADLAAAAGGAMMSRATIIDDVCRYVAFLREHMDKEEREIFPRLGASLQKKDWFLVDSAIHLGADPLFGDAVQARFSGIQRQIAAQAGCGCAELTEKACCLE
ncbi:hemerythrin domain-containing protein [Azoarcus sp. PA01]|nr:hemerythrin domain-containing protein [Azoarcus sp. PA01]